MQNKPSKLFEGENSSLKRTFEKCLGVDEISVSSQEITKDNWEENYPIPESEEWKVEYGNIVSKAWKDGIWHSESTLFSDTKNFIENLLSSQSQKLVSELKEKIWRDLRDSNLITHYTGGSSVEQKDIRIKLEDALNIINNINI